MSLLCPIYFFADNLNPATKTIRFVFEVFDVFEADVHDTVFAGIEAFADGFPDLVGFPGRADHGGIGPPGEDVVGPDLLSAFTRIGPGGNGDAAQCLELPEHVDLLCEVFATAVMDKPIFFKNGNLVLKEELVVELG